MTPLHHHTIQANLANLLPTQGAIGYAEVSQKRAEWQGLSKKMRKALIAQHWFPSVLGPLGPTTSVPGSRSRNFRALWMTP